MTEDDILRQAMAIARSRRDPEKLRANARAIAESRKGTTWTEEQKAALKESQRLRRERERQARRDAGESVPDPNAPKRAHGRPRKHPVNAVDPNAPKRKPGRPRKKETNHGD